MKIHKPYLSLSKTTESYLLEVVLLTTKSNCITSIVQQEVGGSWGVIITVSDKIQIVNGPEYPVISTTVSIDLDKSETYQKIKCAVQQEVAEGEFGPAQPQESDIDFSDGN